MSNTPQPDAPTTDAAPPGSTWSDLSPQERALLDAHGGEPFAMVRPSMIRALDGRASCAVLLAHYLYLSRTQGDELGMFDAPEGWVEVNTGLSKQAQIRARKQLGEMRLLEVVGRGDRKQNILRLNLKGITFVLTNAAQALEARRREMEKISPQSKVSKRYPENQIRRYRNDSLQGIETIPSSINEYMNNSNPPGRSGKGANKQPKAGRQGSRPPVVPMSRDWQPSPDTLEELKILAPLCDFDDALKRFRVKRRLDSSDDFDGNFMLYCIEWHARREREQKNAPASAAPAPELTQEQMAAHVKAHREREQKRREELRLKREKGGSPLAIPTRIDAGSPASALGGK